MFEVIVFTKKCLRMVDTIRYNKANRFRRLSLRLCHPPGAIPPYHSHHA